MTSIAAAALVISIAMESIATDYQDRLISKLHNQEIIESFAENTSKLFILDMDMSSDVDDVCALQIALQYHKAGKIDLKAVMYSVTGDNNIEALQGFLDYNCVADVSIGRCNIENYDTSDYWDIMAEYRVSDCGAEDAVVLYREILAGSEEPVNIITTGYLVNLEQLLQSDPDRISDKTGAELVAEKCAQLYVTGGSDESGYDNNFSYNATDASAAKYVAENWPGQIIYFPNNVGGSMICGKGVQEADAGCLVSRALYAFGTSEGRYAWDPFAVWCALNGMDMALCRIKVESVEMFIADDGWNLFTRSEAGKDYIVGITESDLSWYNTELDRQLIP